ncbi:unnamed protein product [Caenorhabditis bovis]|uniref:BRCA1-associated protein n=1 Tax=Caenorhabditis bovis TaxID=2654633 RepID=A0A8S1FES3_9PELO|nr:unnamed protein product [Caenorhabditis bovis]
MSSLYIPLVLRLEVEDHSKTINSFFDDSQATSDSPTAGERTRRRLITGMKKRNVIPKKETGAPPTIGESVSKPSHEYHKGRRTYSEVLVSTLEADKLLSTPSSSSTTSLSKKQKSSKKTKTLDLEHTSYYYGNPLTEKTEGIMHFYKYTDEKLMKAAQCRMLCMLAVPAQVSVREIITFLRPALPAIEKIKVVRDTSPNQYMLIIKFKEHNDAVTFYEEYNNCQFNDLEPHKCVLLFVDRIECTTSDDLLSTSSAGLTELPTCAVCLEKMDESVLAILCNHTFHALCLEQWADNTCPVCRYIQSPEVVAEQRCNDCGQSSDLWICLICGNIGCGRYASQHAQKHWELTSHTYSMKVGGERVWDYAGDNYVHRLIENDSDGKLVEYQRDQDSSSQDKNSKDDKLEGIKLEYTLLLTGQLEDQRKFFEGRLADVEQAMAKMEKVAMAQVETLEAQISEQSQELKEVKSQLNETIKQKSALEKKLATVMDKNAKLSAKLKDEQDINQMLRKDQQGWKDQLEKLTASSKISTEKYERTVEELQSQVNDLLMHFESQERIKEQLANGSVTQKEIAQSQVGVQNSPSMSKHSKKGKK